MARIADSFYAFQHILAAFNGISGKRQNADYRLAGKRTVPGETNSSEHIFTVLLEAACNRFKKARGLGNTKYAQLNACGIILAKYSPQRNRLAPNPNAG